MQKIVGVIGSGSFGITVAKLLSENVKVLLFTRRDSVMEAINERKFFKGVNTDGKITAVNDLKYVADRCKVIMPVVPSASFRKVMRALAPHVGPEHILIHATKGLDISTISEKRLENESFTRKDVYSMGEVILDETTVLRIGCMSGPNLAKEILNGKPAATVIASEFMEVIRIGQQILGSKLFTVFGSYDMRGAELAGAFKNIIAIGSGILDGLDLGKNMQATLITRGLREMIQFGQTMGADSRSFLGTAGIGDLIATATSENSRNYAFGQKLASGDSPDQILKKSTEVVEGVGTLKIIHLLAEKENLQLPITTMLYRAIHTGYDVKRAIRLLMTYNYAQDVDFL
ncbi:MAG: NAD(P)H-dependent glycerol-3-phosphate dehydrogenase [Bacteroidota bacterium]